MTDELSTERAVAQLAEIPKRRGLPAKAKALAESLVDRLTSPVRITLMGSPETPKAALVNAIAGLPVVTVDTRLPTLELSHGDTAALRVTQRDGSITELQGHDFAAPEMRGASFVQMAAPLERLRDIRLLDLATDGTDAQQIAAAKWAAPLTDIAIWVTLRFDEAQRRLWQRMPDAMQDHNFLVPVVEEGSRRPGKGRGSDFFLGVFPVRQSADRNIVEDEWLEALLRELKNCVNLGRQADLAQADLFLDRFGLSVGSGAKPDRNARSSDRPASDADRSALETALAGASGDAPTDVRDRHRQALELIVSGSRVLLDDLSNPASAPEAGVTARCCAIVEDLAEIVPPESPLHGRTMQAADYMVLLDLERETDADNAAASVLLQLKRAFEVELAA